MRNVARGLAAIIALAFLIFGVRYMFAPAGLMASAGLEAVSGLGFATVRALIGASFLTFGILLVMHTVVNQETGSLRFTILFLLLLLITNYLYFLCLLLDFKVFFINICVFCF